MIRNPHTLANLDIMAGEFYKIIEKELDLSRKLATHKARKLRPLFDYLKNNLFEIITGRPSELEAKISNITNLIDQAKKDFLKSNPVIRNNQRKRVKKLSTEQIDRFLDSWALGILQNIFNYDDGNESFIKKDNNRLAYDHAARLNVNTCPYCNANFTYTMDTGNVKCRPQFDHFLKKSQYPYFALSFYNLIPSCQFCNSGALKGQKPFLLTTHLHPLIEDMDSSYEFRTNIDAVDFLVDKKDFTLVLQPCKGVPDDTRAERNIAVFALNDRYSFHKDIAGEIIAKAYVYNRIALENLYLSFRIGGDSIFSSKEEIKELVMGNYLHPDRFHKRIFSKLTRDICEEFGLQL